MAKLLTTILLLSIVSLTLSTQPSISDLVQQSLESYLQKEGTTQNFTAIQASYLGHGETTSANFAAGTMEKGSGATDLTTDNLLAWGSITKEFTTSLVMILVDQGKLDFEETMESYFSEYFTTTAGSSQLSFPQEWRTIKLYQMLNMTSGIPDYFSGAQILETANALGETFLEFIQKASTYEDLVSIAIKVFNEYKKECSQQGSCFAPGTSWNYSNTNYMLAGMLVSKLFGNEAVEDLYQKYILSQAPQGQVMYYANGVLPDNIFNAMPHAYTTLPFLKGVDVSTLPWYTMRSTGGLIGTTESLTHMIRLLFTEGIANQTPAGDVDVWKYFTNTATGQVVTDYQADCGGNGCYGLGIGITYDDTHGINYHYIGMPFGFRSVYFYYPCYDLVVAASINSAIPDFLVTHQLVYDIMDNLAEASPDVLTQVGGDSVCPKKTVNKTSHGDGDAAEMGKSMVSFAVIVALLCVVLI